MSDKEDDLKIGINSSAIFFGDYAADAVGLFFAGTIGLLAYLGVVLGLKIWFWLGWAIAVISWVGQYIRLNQADLPKPAYGVIFGQNVWLGFIILLGMILGQ
jgi:4-hydroxybenzoate polyprenyltransferase